MTYKHWILIFLTFTLELKVKANDQILTPRECLKLNNYPCQITFKKSAPVLTDAFQLSGLKESILILKHNNSFEFISGTLLIETIDEITLSTLYGSIKVFPQSQLIIERRENQIRVHALKGKVEATPLGEVRSFEILSGTFNDLLPVKNKTARLDFPKVLDLKSTLNLISSLTWKSKETILDEVDHLKYEISNSAKKLSNYSRTIASDLIIQKNQEIEKQKKLQEQQVLEDQKIRDKTLKRLLFLDEVDNSN